MKIKYVLNPSGSGQLVAVTEEAFNGADREINDFFRKFWTFVQNHRRHILRKHYDECKIADVFPPTQRLITEEGAVIIANFFSPWVNHKPYIEILMQELHFTIEDLPEPCNDPKT